MGNFSNVDLEKVLAGKKASVSASVGGNTEGLSGSCSPKDFETLMQLVYLSFTAPRMDNDAFTSFKNRLQASLANQEANPMTALQDTLQKALYMGHPRTIRMKADMVDKIDYARIMEMYKDRFKDASDFTFIFVGNIKPEEMEPLIATYLGALPSVNRKETFRDNHIDMRQGDYKNIFNKKLETPKATVLVINNGQCAYTLKNQIMMSMLSQILNIMYTESVREKEGGTYGVSAFGSLTKYPKEKAVLQIYFDTDPAKRAKMTDIILNELNQFANEGPSTENLNKVKEFMLKKYKENKNVIHAVEAHHGDVEATTIEAVLVQAADAISAARPGARRETLVSYVQRLEELEKIATSFDGVEKSFAIQAGREVRIMVKPDSVNDDDMMMLSRDIAKKIESEMEYPGNIKVNVIRETRAVEYAK